MQHPAPTIVRGASPADHRRIAEVAADGNSPDADPAYLTFVAGAGRLLVAEHDGEVIGFGGMVPVGDVAMVTDLFVAPSERGAGIGGQLLESLLSGWSRRMTCGSTHPAALPAYRRAGMEPRWRVRYLVGVADGTGDPVTPAAWTHDRAELVEHFRSLGAVVTAHAVVQQVGHSFLLRRLCTVDAAGAIEVMERLLAGLPAAAPVEVCVPEHRPLTAWLLSRGFVEVDHDVFCATPGVDLGADVSCVHPGLL